MKRSKLVTEKIDELTQIAQIEGEVNVQIVLLAIRGARESNQDGLLAGIIQDFVKRVLIPNVEAAEAARKTSLN